MCLGTTGRIVEMLNEDHMVLVDFDGITRQISTAIITAQGEKVATGDWVHVHMGFALEKTDESHALESIEFQRALERGEFPTLS